MVCKVMVHLRLRGWWRKGRDLAPGELRRKGLHHGWGRRSCTRAIHISLSLPAICSPLRIVCLPLGSIIHACSRHTRSKTARSLSLCAPGNAC